MQLFSSAISINKLKCLIQVFSMTTNNDVYVWLFFIRIAYRGDVHGYLHELQQIGG
ncbi:hypothetical protein GCM10007877_34050 [Marinibactrum halimedae]|uniref:Uncharacterized protein n=1 Tax=Marinibactrum halimedae TaxID=1444977 RepID=A0AA37TCA2_9GAMM|nr:hypothetical protein GCM10007877_34050 [Marinibactrum halimedae]